MFYLKGIEMVELATALATLCAYLAWCLHVKTSQTKIYRAMLCAVMDGKIGVHRNEDGEIEVKLLKGNNNG
jgi:hypothetical protein